jgi:hypothetical protein
MDTDVTSEGEIHERPNVLLIYFAAALGYVAAGILAVTAIGAIRVLTLADFGESEPKFWAVAIIVSVGTVMAGIAATCGRVLRRVI